MNCVSASLILLTLLLWSGAGASPAHAPKPPPTVAWEVFQDFAGTWVGTGSSIYGESTVTLSVELIGDGSTIWLIQLTADYAPQEANPDGERHEEVAIFSGTESWHSGLLRQFHGEGFEIEYFGEVGPAGELVFESVSTHGLPEDWRARETWRFHGEQLVQTFEVAEPEQDYELWVTNTLRRVNEQ